MIRMEDASRLKKWLFDTFMAHARKVGPAILDAKPVGLWDRMKYAAGQRADLRPAQGYAGPFSRVRVGYTAGEAIGPEIFDFYRSLGINLKQLYGQTEASVFITLQPDGEVRSDTVGVPAPGVEVRISDGRRGLLPRARRLRVLLQERREHEAKTKDAGWLGRHRRCRLLRGGLGASADHRPRQGCGQDGRRARCSRRNTSRTSSSSSPTS